MHFLKQPHLKSSLDLINNDYITNTSHEYYMIMKYLLLK